MKQATKRRTIVVPIIRNGSGEVLLCKMPQDRGVFPGQWGLPGCGIEDGEDMGAALRREVREELGVAVTEFHPLFFYDETRAKRLPDDTLQNVYMIYLLFECRIEEKAIELSDEFCDFAWVAPKRLEEMDLNPATRKTTQRYGILIPAAPSHRQG